MLPNKSWLVHFARRDGGVELYECYEYSDAMRTYNLFNERNADIYTEIQLIERDWEKDEADSDTVIKRKVFE